jgi:hypothetical protein
MKAAMHQKYNLAPNWMVRVPLILVLTLAKEVVMLLAVTVGTLPTLV